MRMINLLKEIKRRFVKLYLSPEEYARYIGVNIGVCNLLQKGHWSTEPYLVTIGSHCQLTNCRIHTHGGGNIIREIYPDFDMFGKVVIGDWVYIGTGAQIMPGVTIEDHVLVAAGSIVTQSIPSGCIVAGNPARIVGHIEDYIERNIQWNVCTKNKSPEEKKNFLLEMSDDRFIHKLFMTEK